MLIFHQPRQVVKLCSFFAFDLVVRDFTLQSQLISDKKSQKDLHSCGGHFSSSDHCEEYPSSHVVLRRSSDIRGPLPWNAAAADAVAAVGSIEEVGPAAALSLSGAVQGLAQGLQPRDRRLKLKNRVGKQ